MKFYTVSEISKLLKVNPETVRRWIREEKLSSIRGDGRQGHRVTDTALTGFLIRNAAFVTPEILTELSSSNAATTFVYTGISKFKTIDSENQLDNITKIQDLKDLIDKKNTFKMQKLMEIQQIDNEIETIY